MRNELMRNLIERDQHNRNQALDPRQSIIIKAPAGSGKTELLIQRVLTLLCYVSKPEEILCVTFTKKSAFEMRLRIINALTFAKNHPKPELSYQQKTWEIAQSVLQRDQLLKWNLISNPNQLRIQTIDSFCSYLTKQLPIQSRFGSQPEIVTDAFSLYQEAVDQVLNDLDVNEKWSQSIENLLLHLDNDINKLQELLVLMLSKRDQWLSFVNIHAFDNDPQSLLEEHIRFVIHDQIHKIKRLLPKECLINLVKVANYTAQFPSKINLSSISYINPDKLIEQKGMLQLDDWLYLIKTLLTNDYTWRIKFNSDIGFLPLSTFKNKSEKQINKANRALLKTCIDLLKDSDELLFALKNLTLLPDLEKNQFNWPILNDLLIMLKLAAAQLRLIFQKHGSIDFIENTQSAILALGPDDEPTDLTLALDYQIKHILIDEFQDTSITQYQLLEKLIQEWRDDDGRTLFVVGDPMQSIYRFREAEVGLFLRMEQYGIAHIHLKPLQLYVNYRSDAHIVNWNNIHFKQIFPKFNDISLGAVAYSKSTSNTDKNPGHQNVFVKGFLNIDDQTNYIINIIKTALETNPSQKIAILVRARSHAASIIPVLKKASIPYQSLEIEPLKSKQIINDLLALSCAILNVSDRIAWLSLLRSPVCGLTLSDLLVFSDETKTIFEQLESNETLKKLSADGHIRAKQFHSILKNQVENRGRYDLRYATETCWKLLGGPIALHDFSDIADAHEFFELLSLLQNNNQNLFDGEQLKKQIEDLYATTPNPNANLQIMTIHAAKGLEFDTVIIPHLEMKPPPDKQVILSWLEYPLTEKKNALLLSAINETGQDKDKIYEFIKEQKRLKNQYEIDRLFYVASTRAKSCMHLTYLSQLNSKVKNNSFLEKLCPYLNKTEPENSIAHFNQQSHSPILKQLKPFIRYHSDWSHPFSVSTKNEVAPHQQSQGFCLRDDDAKLIGIVIHQLLYQISINGFHWWQDAPKHEQNFYIQFHLKKLNLSKHALIQAANQITKAIDLTLRDEWGQWILSPHQDAQSEFALTTYYHGAFKKIVIDRTFIDESGTRWIIDYKTFASSELEIESILSKESKRYEEQLNIYLKAMTEYDNRPITLGLYFPNVAAWKVISQ